MFIHLTYSRGGKRTIHNVPRVDVKEDDSNNMEIGANTKFPYQAFFTRDLWVMGTRRNGVTGTG